MNRVTYEEAVELTSRIVEPISKDLKRLLIAMDYWSNDKPYMSYSEYSLSDNSVLLMLKDKVNKEYK